MEFKSAKTLFKTAQQAFISLMSLRNVFLFFLFLRYSFVRRWAFAAAQAHRGAVHDPSGAPVAGANGNGYFRPARASTRKP